MRSRLAGPLAAALILAGCGASSTAPPSALPDPTAATSPIASPTPTGSPAPTATATPAAAGHWEEAGSLAVGRAAPHVVAVGDTGVLVVGNDDCGYDAGWPQGPFGCSRSCIRADSRVVEAWSASGEAWMKVGPLSAPRTEMAIVALADGRALVAGGVQAASGREAERPWLQEDHHVSLSRTSLFDGGTGHWTPAAAMSTPRTAPIAALLRDGRVLVAGGYDLDAPTGPWTMGPGGRLDPTGEIVLAAHRPTSTAATGPAGAILANMIPSGPDVPVMATAELYDPVTDTWSATGPMRVARYGDAAVTLADGRVLVVPNGGPTLGIGVFGWDGRPPREHELAGTLAEIYDPRTGRFSLAGELPSIDVAPLNALGHDVDEDSWDVTTGSLVALADGGALVAGRSAVLTKGGSVAGFYARTLRFDPATTRWAEIDRTALMYRDAEQGDFTLEVVARGHVLPASLAAPMADGRVLVAGGLRSSSSDFTEIVTSSDAAVFDPSAGTWAAAPSMPEGRAGGAVVALADGSAILVGGYPERVRPGSMGYTPGECGAGSTGSRSAVRFVPGS